MFASLSRRACMPYCSAIFSTQTQSPSVDANVLDFQPIQPVRTFEAVEQRIREQIASGRLRPGDKLPSERELAEQLRVGRNTVREALRSLENAGVLSLTRGVKGGAFIREGSNLRITQAVTDLVALGSVSLDDLTELRIHLLDAVVRLACERATPQQIAELDAVVQSTKDANDAASEGKRLDAALEFYRLLAAATQNRAFAMMVASIGETVVRLLGTISYPPEKLFQARCRFMVHFQARDADAACKELNALLVALRDHAKRVSRKPRRQAV